MKSTATHQNLEIFFRRRTEFKPDPANPRQHTKKQIQQIAKSIRSFGFNVPILIDPDDNVIAGNGRVFACGELGIDEVPTVCLDHLTPAQVRAFRIADNKLTENATWDERLLGEQVRDLSLSGLNFDVEVTRFEVVPEDLAAPRSAGSGICGILGRIAFYAATLSIPRFLPR
jgi:ParB-like chromosome segregation protein Spo0J